MAKEDTVSVIVSDIARDLASQAGGAVPLVHRPIERIGPHISLLRLISLHPSHPALMDAIQDDSTLAPLLQGSVFIQSTAGLGWAVQTEMLAEDLIAPAVLTLMAGGKRFNEPEAVAAEAVRNLERLRKLLRGETVSCTATVGIEGLSLRENLVIALPWGRLRSVSEHERRAFPLGSISAVLEVEVPVRYEVTDAEAPAEISDQELESYSALIERPTKLLPLACLLAIEETDVASSVTGSTIYLPGTTGSGGGGRGPRRTGSHSSFELVPEHAGPLRSWAQTVETHYDPSIDVAVRRLFTALGERDDPADALIDVVIALENLFGAGATTEVTFRVTAATALLLEPKGSARAQLRKRLTKAYSVRSQVVHGGEPDWSVVRQARDEVVAVVIRVLRTLFETQPQLVADRNRGMTVLLG